MNQKNSPFIVGLLIIIASWWIGGALLASIAATVLPDTLIGTYLSLNSSFLPFFLSILLTNRYLFGNTLSEFISKTQRSYLNTIIIGLAWLLLFSISTGIEYLLEPGRFSISSDLSSWIVFLPIAILVTPLQTASEELFFRAYLAKWMEHLNARRYLIIGFSGVIFLSVHLLNPEIQTLGADPFIYLYYFLFGSFMMAIALVDKSFLLPIIIHTVNNLFSVILVNYEGTVLGSPALLVDSQPAPLFSTITLTLGSLVTIGYLRYRQDQCRR